MEHTTEFSTEVHGDKIHMIRHTVDILDAEEYLRHYKGVKDEIQGRNDQMESFIGDFTKMQEVIDEAEGIRAAQIEEDKKAREEAVAKNDRKLSEYEN